MNPIKTINTALVIGLLSTAPGYSALIMDWDATNWSGVAGETWIDAVNGVVASPGAGTPIKSTAVVAGNTIDVINFTADSFDVNSTSHPLVGLKQFTISIAFSTTSAGAGSENNFYQWNGLVGKEIGNAGVGDWALGIAPGGLAGGATGLGGGDVGTISVVDVRGAFHTMSFVVQQTSATTFDQYLYVDGVLQSSDVGLTYGSVGAVAASNFAIGARRDGTNGFSDSSIARLQFDDSALSPAEIAASHATFLGEAIPEPTSIALLAFGGLGLLGFRRRA